MGLFDEKHTLVTIVLSSVTYLISVHKPSPYFCTIVKRINLMP